MYKSIRKALTQGKLTVQDIAELFEMPIAYIENIGEKMRNKE